MTKGKEAGRQSGGMDRQSGSMYHDGHLSEKITVPAQYGKNTVQQDRQKDLLPEKDINMYMEKLLQKGNY